MMRSAKDPLIKNLAATLSTRQLLRIAHRMAVYSPENVDLFRKKIKILNINVVFSGSFIESRIEFCL